MIPHRIIAALYWYDEPVETLTRCVTSLKQAGVTDIVALDGRYIDFPGESFRSPKEQYDAIEQAANSVGIRPMVRGCTRPWDTQAAKVTALWRTIGEHFTAGRDYVLVISADEYIEKADTGVLREQLAFTGAEAFSVDFHTLPNPDETPDEAALAPCDYVARSGKKRRLFQLLRNVECTPPYHWVYIGERVGVHHIDRAEPDRCILYGDGIAARVGIPSCRHVELPNNVLVIAHETLHRTTERKQAKAQYVATRTANGRDL